MSCSFRIFIALSFLMITVKMLVIEPNLQRDLDPYGRLKPFEHNLPNGRSCINSLECLSGCCLIVNKIRRCAPQALPGQRCTSYQVKGGMYDNYCRCATGENDCVPHIYQNSFDIRRYLHPFSYCRMI